MSVWSPQTAALPAAQSTPALRLIATLLLCGSLLSLWPPVGTFAAGIEHIVVSELMTGGTSANDEMIELYNPSSVALPLEGLELIYVSATGATVSRRAAWDVGAALMPPGSHLLVAHELGIFAPIADVVYASGMATTGGSVALRIQGAATAIDAVGWGTAASMWLEGTPAPPAPAGSSLERLPGGPAGSTEDTDDNALDFAIRATPDPQNGGSRPVPDPSGTSPTPVPPSPTESTGASPAPTGVPEPTPTPATAIPIATARALPDGTVVTIEGTALTGSDFHDGGGYLADESSGIAVVVDGGTFARGERLLVSGVLDDRFAQRTLRAAGTDVRPIGVGVDPPALGRATASVDESVEGRLVRVAGSLVGGGSPLSGAVAFALDDGSGAVRLIVGNATGIDTAGWTTGRRVELVGVAGQRDSSGSGTTGYRLQPRSAADIVGIAEPTPSGSAEPPSASPSAAPGSLSTIFQARAAERNERLTVRGIVTLPPGVIDPSSAVIQDATGAILLRLGSEVGRLPRGQLVEVEGIRSTKSGMESLRVSRPARRLGKLTEPQPRVLRTGDASEAHEARVVVVRGALVAAARRAASRAVSFEVDDGSGALRVVLGASLRADPGRLRRGSWVEVRGVLGQETSGSQPLRGYRIWPRTAGEVRVTAPASDGASSARNGEDGAGSRSASPLGAALDGAGGAGMRIGATLVLSAWPELGVAGLLWDGQRLVAIAPSSADALASAIGTRPPPLSLELSGLREVGRDVGLGVATVALGPGSEDALIGSSPPHPPTADLPSRGDPARWVTVVGRASRTSGGVAYALRDGSVAVEQACRAEDAPPEGAVSITGVAIDGGGRIVVPCGGIRAASLLARDAGPASHDGPDVGSAADAAAAPAVSREGPRRALAAMLLAVAAAGIGGAAIVRLRIGSDRAAIALGADASGGWTAGAPQSSEPQPQRAQLTLIGVPRERGP